MNIESWLSPNLLDKGKLKELQVLYKGNLPFPHILIKDFLKEPQAKKLLAVLKKEPFEKKQSDLFSLSQTQDFATTNKKDFQEFYKLFQSKKFSKMIEAITGLKLNSHIDMAGSLYEDTDYLLCHDDQLEERKVAYVYYLESFAQHDGGALALLDDNESSPGKTTQRYLPLANSIVLFTVSHKSWHEVEEVLSKKKRYAIGGWLY